MTRAVDSDDQSSIPTQPISISSLQPHGVSDSVAATFGVKASAIGGAWQPPAPEELQRDFPLYEIRGILGRGGMGAVYKGWQKSLDRFVAIKILPPGLDEGSAGFSERFKREAKAMAQLQHPGIVAVFDAGTTSGGLLYFVMECITGTDMQRLAAERGRLDPGEALRITSAVCDALGYAHEHGLIHRDIKPSNIMLDARGTVKVADFGLAKSTAPETTMLTMSSVAMGTPDFMAPESFKGVANVDHRADIYAVGVMLYQMLTGEIPRVMFKLPSRSRPELGTRFDALICKALETDPADRFQSAAEMRRELDAVAGANTATPSAPRGVSKQIRVVIAAVILLATGGWFFFGRGHGTAPVASSPRTVTADAVLPGDRVVDLLALVEVKRDVIVGEWSRTTDGLAVRQSPDTINGSPRLQLPCTPPEEYDFEIEFTAGEGDGFVGQALSAAGHPFTWVVDMGLIAGRKAGFGMLNGKLMMDNTDASVMRKQLLTNGQRHVSRVEVRKGKALGYLDGEKLVEWGSGHSDFAQFDIHPKSAMRDALHLGIIAANRAVTFHKITVREISGTGKLDADVAVPNGSR